MKIRELAFKQEKEIVPTSLDQCIVHVCSWLAPPMFKLQIFSHPQGIAIEFSSNIVSLSGRKKLILKPSQRLDWLVRTLG